MKNMEIYVNHDFDGILWQKMTETCFSNNKKQITFYGHYNYKENIITMNYSENDSADDRKDQSQNENNAQPGGRRIDNGAGLNEEDLEKTFLFDKGGNAGNPTEGKGVGGQNFGKENNTPAGNDKNNPTQMAGHTNAYFDRHEPSDEHPEDSNFTAEYQQGAPDYDKAQPNNNSMENNAPKPEKVERGNGENDRPHAQQTYTEGTDDNDGNTQTNIPGPNELPDQQKVGEDDGDEHIQT